MSSYTLLLMALLLHMTIAVVYNVRSEDGNSNDTESAESLGYYLKNASKYFSSHSKLLFQMGYHNLNTIMSIQNVTNVTLTGEGVSIIRCTSLMGIFILDVTNFKLENIVFENCSANYSNHLHTGFRYHSASISESSGNASILLHQCLSVTISNITVIVHEGIIGVLIVNVRGYTNISNIHISIQENSGSVNVYGILFYHDNWKNPTSKSSVMQLDNFQFTTNRSYSHPIYHAIKILSFQNNTNISIVIQNTKFTDLINVTALHYYGEACGIAISNFLTIRNCVVSNNIGSPSLKMFYITLHNIQCIRFFEYIKSYHLQQRVHVIFTNCKFENNFNMLSILYVSPLSSRSVTCYLHILASSFHSNKNAHLFVMRNDEDNMWQRSNYLWIRNISITSNVHDRGQDLMSFANSKVQFFGPIKIMDNKYYTNIFNFYLTIGDFKYNITIINNTVRQLLTGAFINLKANTVVIMSRNIVYTLLNQIYVYSINSEPICRVQFFSEYDYLNVSKFMTHVTISSNIHMISKYIPNYNYRCRWLAGSAFQKAGLKPKFVFGSIVKIENNTVVREDIKRPIPLSICKCVHYDAWSGAQLSDYYHDCYSSHLGSIFPGQNLEVVLVVKKQSPLYYNTSAINVAVYNTKDDDCSVASTFQLSQTRLDHGCNNYSYTLWPKDETIKVCKLFIGIQNMPEMFHVHIKPCPLGFTLQEEKKSCYCDPLLNSHKVISIKSCNLSDETISRPGYQP